MKKTLLLVAALLSLPVVCQADVSIGVNVPGISIHIGDRDDRGYYWDGGRWRDPQWWSEYRAYKLSRENYEDSPSQRGYYEESRHYSPHYRMPPPPLPPPPLGYSPGPGPHW